MTKEELINLLDDLDENSLKDQGIFGIYQYGGDPKESFIKANKEGLQIFALQLIEASYKLENNNISNEEKIISLDYQEKWIDRNSEIFIDFIEPTTKVQSVITDGQQKETLADKLTPYGCGAVLIIFGISVLVGFIQILEFLVSLFKNH